MISIYYKMETDGRDLLWHMEAKVKGKRKVLTLNKCGEPGIFMMGNNPNYSLYIGTTRSYFYSHYKDLIKNLNDITEIKHFKDGKEYDRLVYKGNKYYYFKDGKEINDPVLSFCNDMS